MPGKKTERNTDLYDDHCSGMTNTELVKKYGITRERVRQIIAQQNRVHGEIMGIDTTFGVETVRISAQASWRKRYVEKLRRRKLKNEN